MFNCIQAECDSWLVITDGSRLMTEPQSTATDKRSFISRGQSKLTLVLALVDDADVGH